MGISLVVVCTQLVMRFASKRIRLNDSKIISTPTQGSLMMDFAAGTDRMESLKPLLQNSIMQTHKLIWTSLSRAGEFTSICQQKFLVVQFTTKFTASPATHMRIFRWDHFKLAAQPVSKAYINSKSRSGHLPLVQFLKPHDSFAKC